jgi:hypothetical protein
MVAAGQRALAERGIAAPLVWAPPCIAPAMGGVFDALIVGWNGYCCISPRERRIVFLKSLRAQLKPSAPMLVSMAMRGPKARLVKWTPRVANAVRTCTFRPPVFEAGNSFSGRRKMHFTRRQIEREIARRRVFGGEVLFVGRLRCGRDEGYGGSRPGTRR